ncbi:unnamed protein product [Caenorhabditis sp. 36 PRJEB53466]|nr:unnamed protein product [Caenorhabditis sp. 36 PRJEB53466]
MIAFLTLLTGFLLLICYFGVLLSWTLSVLTKSEVRVGRIGFFMLRDISIKTASSLSIHIEEISLHRERAHPTRFFVLRIDDARIEAEKSQNFPRDDFRNLNRSDNFSYSNFQRLTRIAQYCQLIVNRVHFVVMNIVPDCLLHITIDELSLETFRSREGWQYEASCTLIQGKLLKRNAKSGSLLAELSLPFQLSLDIEKSTINSVSLRVSAPSLAFTNNFIVIVEQVILAPSSNGTLLTKSTDQRSSIPNYLNNLQFKLDIKSISTKYTSYSGNDSSSYRYITCSIKQILAIRSNHDANLTFVNFIVIDQFLRSEVRMDSVKLVFSENSHFSTSQIRITIDSVHSKLVLPDVQWWKEDSMRLPFTKISQWMSNPKTNNSDTKFDVYLETFDVFCDIVDFNYKKSIFRMSFMSFETTDEQYEVGIEFLSFGSLPDESQFEVHSWGEHLFLGALILQWKNSASDLDITIGCDDMKIEWSDRLAEQLAALYALLRKTDKKSEQTKKRNFVMNTSVNRFAFFIDDCSCFAAAYCSTFGICAESRDKFEVDFKFVRAIDEKLNLVISWKETTRQQGDGIYQSPKPLKPENHVETVEHLATNSFCLLILYKYKSIPVLVFYQSIKKLANRESETVRRVPRKYRLMVMLDATVEVQLELARNHRISWIGEKFSWEFFDSQAILGTSMLDVILNKKKIISVLCFSLNIRSQDQRMTESRLVFATLESRSNKVWIWTADKFRFYLPFDFNFARVFDEFINIIKWIKIVHNIRKNEFTEKSALPSDVQINLEEVCLELEDDEFENRLKLSAQLKEDEVYESERREQLLDERLANLKKTVPFLSKEMIESMKKTLIMKNSEIYIERWKMSEVSDSPLFLSTWKGWKMRAFADMSLHGTETCVRLMKTFDPLSPIPEQEYSTLWARAVEFDVDEWSVTFKDYPMKYLDIKDLHFYGFLVAAESIPEEGRSFRECSVPLPEPYPTLTVQRNMSPLKFYYDLQCASTDFNCTYGPCWEPCLSMISLDGNVLVIRMIITPYIFVLLRDCRIIHPLKNTTRFASSVRLAQTVQHSSTNRDMNVQRRKVYSWNTHHMTCTWWATQIHVYGGESQPPRDGSPSEDTFLLGFGRVQYSREIYPGKDTPLHKVAAYDLKMAWTSENRDACLTIADGVHRAHMLRRILSNDAMKTLNIHLEPTVDAKPKEPQSSRKEKTHRRGYSVTEANPWMLSQLIDEVGTKLVAHCEQASDVPIDSLLGVQQSTMDDVKLLNWQIDLYNSQLVLKGCERDGFLIVCAAKSQLLQNFHRNVWKKSLLLSKKSWSAKLSGMQYFAPISATGTNKKKFRWLPREVIDEKCQDVSGFADDFVQKFTAAGEAVGGVVQPEFDYEEDIQLQRIVSRCSCQIYFCYFSDELKTDSSEDISVPPKLDPSHQSLSTDSAGIDVLTLKHNMLEATSNSEQYEMVVDIINNLALFVDPNKKEIGDKRRRQRFECQLMSISELRSKIMKYQSELREIVSLGRFLERQLFYINQGEHESVEYTEEQISLEAEETKQRMLSVSDLLATYISSYKQRQVNQMKNYDDHSEKKGVEVIRRFEVCFEDCIWKLTESDGQIALAQTQIRNFLYTRTVRDSNCGDHLFEVGSVRIANLLPDSIYKNALHRDETRHSRQPAIRLFVRDMPPVGGISVKEHFELNIAPMVAAITHRLFDKMMRFFFPGRNIHTNDSLEAEVDSSKFSFTRKIASSLSMRSNRSATGKIVLQDSHSEKDDIDRMKERADKVNHFMYIKIPEVSFVVSYKGNKDKSLIDVNQFNFVFPLCEYHEQNWTWLDLALAVKQRCKRVLLQQFMRQKLLRNRISNFSIDVIPQGISEDEKKRIAVGTSNTDQKVLKDEK